MRVSPCGYFANSLEEALDLAKQSAEVTHNHPEGIKGAQAIAAAIFLARQHKSENILNGLLITTSTGLAMRSDWHTDLTKPARALAPKR